MTLGVVGFTFVMLKVRKVQLARDGNDYKGGLGDFIKILRNSDFEQHKAKDAKTSVRAWKKRAPDRPFERCSLLADPTPRIRATTSQLNPILQVDQYATLFDGARKEVGAISSEESIEGRRSQYQTMITNFYDLVS